ncbi:MAG TPA: helix-turn-helix transcriptional regulator [Mycobacteriales bacterium]|nr:helix-turn-helix transcriptional regulator [Mycobacteriales bacterium]
MEIDPDTHVPHNSPSGDQTRTPAPHGVLRGHVVTAVGVLRTRIAESWTLDTLADEVHLSRSQLARAFDATVGMSPMAYLRRMRVERMARLLTSTDLSIAEAARMVGWKHQFHASRCFHAHYGISPTEYRRRQSAPPVR